MSAANTNAISFITKDSIVYEFAEIKTVFKMELVSAVFTVDEAIAIESSDDSAGRNIVSWEEVPKTLADNWLAKNPTAVATYVKAVVVSVKETKDSKRNIDNIATACSRREPRANVEKKTTFVKQHKPRFNKEEEVKVRKPFVKKTKDEEEPKKPFIRKSKDEVVKKPVVKEEKKVSKAGKFYAKIKEQKAEKKAALPKVNVEFIVDASSFLRGLNVVDEEIVPRIEMAKNKCSLGIVKSWCYRAPIMYFDKVFGCADNLDSSLINFEYACTADATMELAKSLDVDLKSSDISKHASRYSCLGKDKDCKSCANAWLERFNDYGFFSTSVAFGIYSIADPTLAHAGYLRALFFAISQLDSDAFSFTSQEKADSWKAQSTIASLLMKQVIESGNEDLSVPLTILEEILLTIASSKFIIRQKQEATLASSSTDSQ